MSSDAYGVPQRKYTFGRDIGLDGQRLVVGAMPRMMEHLCWSRTDSVTAAAAVTPYLIFDTPPMPIGSVIRITGHGVQDTGGGATGQIALGLSRDWLVTAPTVTLVASIEDATINSNHGAFMLIAGIRGRNSVRGAGMLVDDTNQAQGGEAAAVTTFDFGTNQRWGVYCTNVGGGSAIEHALVEVFIPRAYL